MSFSKSAERNRITIKDEDVQKYYDAHKSELKSDEKRKVEFVRIVILLHILIFDSDVVLEISRTKSDHAHEKFVVAAPKIFIQLVFGNGNACSKEFFDFVQANLIARQLFNVLLAESHRPQPVSHEIAELGNIEA